MYGWVYPTWGCFLQLPGGKALGAFYAVVSLILSSAYVAVYMPESPRCIDKCDFMHLVATVDYFYSCAEGIYGMISLIACLYPLILFRVAPSIPPWELYRTCHQLLRLFFS